MRFKFETVYSFNAADSNIWGNLDHRNKLLRAQTVLTTGRRKVPNVNALVNHIFQDETHGSSLDLNEKCVL